MKEAMRKARKCVIGHASVAAAGCGAFKIVVPIPKVETVVLTKTTMDMCKKIAKIYGYDKVAGITQLAGVATGAAFGITLAGGILEVIPGLGPAACVASTSILHLTTGALMIAVFEMMDEGVIDATSLNESNIISTINTLASDMTGLVGNLLRGDIKIPARQELKKKDVLTCMV